MSARLRFVQTRKYIVELDTIKARLSELGDEWQPEGVHVKGISDPTANQATFNVDVLGNMLDKLREREEELEIFIGETLVIIAHVREGLGYEYAMILDQRYIDGLPWSMVQLNGKTINRSTGKRKVSIAFDWIDSIGLERLTRGLYTI